MAALYGWNGGESSSVPATKVLAFLDNVLALPAGAQASKGGVAGISLDIEPRIQNASLDQYQQYADLLPKLRAKLDAANAQRALTAAAAPLTLSIAGSWGYESRNVSCASPDDVTKQSTTSMLECAVRFVDT